MNKPAVLIRISHVCRGHRSLPSLCAHGWETWRANGHGIRHLGGGSTKSDAQILRHRVLQQRNFIKIVESSLGPAGRIFMRGSFGIGLVLRALVRGLGSLLGGARCRLAFRADLHCLCDFIA